MCTPTPGQYRQWKVCPWGDRLQGRRQLQCKRGAVAGELPHHPVTCWAPCTSPKTEGKPAVLFWFPFRSRILYCVSGKLLTASAGVLFVPQPVLFARKKDSCVTMNQQMGFFC